jgi:hypothetical protein
MSVAAMQDAGLAAKMPGQIFGISAGMLAGTAFMGGGIAAQLVAAKAETQLEEIANDAKRYIYTEDIQRALAAKVTADAYEKETQLINKTMDEIDSLETDKKIAKYYSVILPNIKSYGCVSTQKQAIIDGITSLSKKVLADDIDEDTYDNANDMISVLIRAYNNPFLTTRDENWIRQGWYDFAKKIFQRICRNKKLRTRNGIDVNFKGEYLWLPEQFENPGRGLVVFEAKAHNDVFVGFAKESDVLRNSVTHMYEMVLGKWGNTKTEISRRSLGDPVAIFDQDEEPYTKLNLHDDKFILFWINVDNGKITIGTGIPDPKNKVAEWQDPYPGQKVTYVGFSSWIELEPAMVRNMMVYPSLAELAKQGKLKEIQEDVAAAYNDAHEHEDENFQEITVTD